ncbi:hypothetical protein PV325_000705 [Microctonus aethiopoides]|nr:hypothetical protein PV325_000705 [Microctonus aethiopoides]
MAKSRKPEDGYPSEAPSSSSGASTRSIELYYRGHGAFSNLHFRMESPLQPYVEELLVKQQRHSDEEKKRGIRRDVAKFGQSPEL